MSRSAWIVGVIALLLAPSARADGVPSPDPLVYGGRVIQNGNPVPAVAVQVVVYSASTGPTTVCGPFSSTSDGNGHFSIPLTGCETRVKQFANLWVEVSLNGSGTGRKALKAMPYAVEADRAQSVTRPVMTSPNGKKYSLNAMPCKAGIMSNGLIDGLPDGGFAQGYQAAKEFCEMSCASETAHMCTSEEMGRYFALAGGSATVREFNDGTPLPDTAWIGSSGGGARSGTATYTTDCFGYKYDLADQYGTVWRGSGVQQELSTCITSHQILCCD